MTDMTNEPASKRPGLIARLGFDTPQDRPKAMLWFEILALFYAGYTILLSFGVVSALQQQYGSSVYIGLLVPSLLMTLLVLFTSRCGSIIAYWLAGGILIQPAVKVLRRVQEFSWDGFIAAQPAEVWPAVAITLTAFILLLQPQNRAWAKQRRAERKARKTTV